MASRELKIPMSHIHICETSTATVPNTIATAASIGADVNGRAVQVFSPIAWSFPWERASPSWGLLSLKQEQFVGFREVIHITKHKFGMTKYWKSVVGGNRLTQDDKHAQNLKVQMQSELQLELSSVQSVEHPDLDSPIFIRLLPNLPFYSELENGKSRARVVEQR